MSPRKSEEDVMIKVGLSPSKKELFYLLQCVFLFHLKSSFRSLDIYTFVLTFWACWKHGLIRNIVKVNFEIYDITAWLTKNYNTYPQIKDNPTMKYGHLIEYPKWNVFFKNYADNEAGKLVSDRFLFFKKALY